MDDRPDFREVRRAPRITADEMSTIMAELATGVPPERSKLALMTEEQLEWRRQVAPELQAAARAGNILDIPADFPDVGDIDQELR